MLGPWRGRQGATDLRSGDIEDRQHDSLVSPEDAACDEPADWIANNAHDGCDHQNPDHDPAHPIEYAAVPWRAEH